MRDLKQTFHAVLRTLHAGAALTLLSCQTELPNEERGQQTSTPKETIKETPVFVPPPPPPPPTVKMEEITRVCASVEPTSFESIVINKKSLGAPCSTATDKDDCRDDIESQLSLLKESEALIIQKGGATSVVELEKLTSTFGTIDVLDEALAIMLANGKREDFCDGILGADGIKFTKNITGSGRCGKVRSITISTTGTIDDVTTDLPCPVVKGRRPDGLQEMISAREDSLGSFFARAAWEEAASVPAFRLLVRDLQHLNAPMHLIQKALASAEDELRHAEQMTVLAEYFGAAVELPLVITPEPKTLLALAEENMREGCVHETFAALVALYQSENASDPDIKGVMKQLAEDEAQHAMLAWEIHEWAEKQLSEEEKQRLSDIQRKALGNLLVQPVSLSAEDANRIGLPSPETRKALSLGLQAELGLS
jgi:hypothetical protein